MRKCDTSCGLAHPAQAGVVARPASPLPGSGVRSLCQRASGWVRAEGPTATKPAMGGLEIADFRVCRGWICTRNADIYEGFDSRLIAI